MADKPLLVGEERILLIVAADDAERASVQTALMAEGYQVLTAATVTAALDYLAQHDVGVVLADWRAEQSDTEFFWRLRELYPQTLRIAIGGGCAAESLIGLINQGAIYKFLLSPQPFPQLREVVREAFLNRKKMQAH